MQANRPAIFVSALALLAACNQPQTAQSGNAADASANPAATTFNPPDFGQSVVSWKPCPRPTPAPNGPVEPAPTDDQPYFEFNGTFGAKFDCMQGGPVLWPARPASIRNEWYLQRIRDLIPPGCEGPPVTCSVKLLRICSKSAAHSDPKEFRAGPCGTAKGAGVFGCEVCLDHLTGTPPPPPPNP